MTSLSQEVRPSQAWNVLPELDVDNKFLALGLYWDKDASQSLDRASSQSHLYLLTFQDPRVENLVPTSLKTVRGWIM